VRSLSLPYVTTLASQSELVNYLFQFGCQSCYSGLLPYVITLALPDRLFKPFRLTACGFNDFSVVNLVVVVTG
jgi:hypothetical protein